MKTLVIEHSPKIGTRLPELLAASRRHWGMGAGATVTRDRINELLPSARLNQPTRFEAMLSSLGRRLDNGQSGAHAAEARS